LFIRNSLSFVTYQNWAAGIRQEARTLAEKVKREGYQQADALTEKASNPILRAAAKPAADKLRKETDEKAAGIIREGDQRADNVVAEARGQSSDSAGTK
jgi:cell division septum initiation protein DivIVA